MKIQLFLLFVVVGSFSFTKSAHGFGSFEHIWIGDTPLLQFPEDGLPEGEQLFTDYPYKRFIEPISALYHVPSISPQYLMIGDLKVSVGEIVAIAGDYFTLVGSSISNADVKISFNPKERFLYAFSSFISDELGRTSNSPRVLSNPSIGREPNVSKQVDQNFAKYIAEFGHYVPWELRAEYETIENPFKPKKSVEQLRTVFDAEFINLLETDPRLATHLAKLKKINMDQVSNLKEIVDKAYKSISRLPSFLEEFRDLHTMLVSKKTTWHLIKETFNWNNPPYYSQILEENLDHFGKYAIQVYKTGHEAAIDVAIKASQQDTKEGQRKWLNIAYALDAFAIHYLSDQFSSGHLRTPRAAIFNASYFSKTAGLAANSMHDEDGYYGLKVKNFEQQWTAFGDYSYFSERSKQNREELERSLEASFDEVFEAFLTSSKDNKFRALDFIPRVTADNFPALFKEDGRGSVLVRDSYENIDVKSYSAPSLISWLHSWTYTPHWKKSTFDIRWLLNQTQPEDTRTLVLVCRTKAPEPSSSKDHSFHMPVLGVQVDLEKMGIDDARKKYFENNKVTLLLSADRVTNSVKKCEQLGASFGYLRDAALGLYEDTASGHVELHSVVTYQSNGAIALQEFPIRVQ